MYIQLADKDKWKSPVLYIHCDEEEALTFINKWKESLVKWVGDNSKGGMPLQRFDPNTAMCDLVYQLGRYYLNSMSEEIRLIGRIQSWLRLFNEEWLKGEEIIIINLP